MSDEATKLARLMLERLCEEAAERGYCVFCTMVCRLQHDHEFENERYCEEAHGDECLERPLTAFLAQRSTSSPPAPVDPVEAVLAVECDSCGAAAGDCCDSWNDGEAVQRAYCGRRIRAALNHTATSEPR